MQKPEPMFTLQGATLITPDGKHLAKPGDPGCFLGGRGKRIPMAKAIMLGLVTPEPAAEPPAAPARGKGGRKPWHKMILPVEDK